MPLTPEQQKELRQLELEQLEEEEAEYQAQQVAPQRAPRIQQPDTPVSSPEATARGLADVLTFGTAKYTAPAIRGGLEAILPKSASQALGLDPYEVEKERYREREKIAQEYEGGSYGAGQGLGFGSQLVGAPFAGAASGARALAGRAFESPAGQAIVGGLQRGAETEFDPSQVGIGALTGGALSGLGTAATKAAQPKLEKMAASRAAKATGADILKPSRRIERMPGGREAYGKDVLEQGIVTAGKSVPQIAETAKAQEARQGEIIGKIYQKFDEIAGGKVPDGFMEKMIAKIQKEVINPLRKTAAKSDMADRLESAYVNRLAQMVDEGYQPSFQGLHDEVRGLADKAYTPSGIDKPLNEQLQKIQRIMRGALQEQAGKLKGGGDLVDLLKQANRKYSIATEAAKTAGEKITRMDTNRMFSLTDYISGAGGLALGGAYGGVEGMLTGATLGILNKLKRERGPQAAAAALNAAQKFAKGDPEKVGVFLNFLLSDQFTGGNEQ